ncbi:MAG: tRNA pseudouridine(38-40) synthase TruA [Capsulimonadales bacterium]|nr:tRNA pseudouridine(38-40) synthase TruA [Capsulimonadales bacterium]
MQRVRLTLEYDGTEFAGFQLQGKGERTVQGVLETAIERLSGVPTRLHGAGRTDAGVHAWGQVAHFDTEWTIPESRIAAALNSVLPSDLSVRDGRRAEPGFHARYDATARVYRYTVLNRVNPSALLTRYAWHVREPLDPAAMRAAAGELTGTYDFAAFGTPDAPGKSTVRRVDRLSVTPRKDCLLITVRGNAFLRQMVRAFVGTLVQAGSGRITPEWVRSLRESGDRARCPGIAPPHGLCLVKVEYDGSRNRRELTELSDHIEKSQETDHEDLFGEAE